MVLLVKFPLNVHFVYAVGLVPMERIRMTTKQQANDEGLMVERQLNTRIRGEREEVGRGGEEGKVRGVSNKVPVK